MAVFVSFVEKESKCVQLVYLQPALVQVEANERAAPVPQPLTPRRNKVLLLFDEGLLNKQIAYELSVSGATMKAHVSAILQKLDASGRIQAVQNARREALLADHERVAAC